MLPQQLSDNSPDVNVFSASRNRWKRLRTIANQTFSPAKLKEVKLILIFSKPVAIAFKLKLFLAISNDENVLGPVD